MTPATLIEANRSRDAAAGISHWSFDRLVGRISARDRWGNLVMAIAADPQFGHRLAAAFGATPHSTRVVERRQQPRPHRQPVSGLADSWRTAVAA